MYRTLSNSMLLGLLLFGLIGCDQNSAQNAVNKADQAIEATDKRVDKVVQSPSPIQPTAKNVDDTLKAVHSTVHSFKKDDKTAASPSSAKSVPEK